METVLAVGRIKIDSLSLSIKISLSSLTGITGVVHNKVMMFFFPSKALYLSLSVSLSLSLSLSLFAYVLYLQRKKFKQTQQNDLS